MNWIRFNNELSTKELALSSLFGAAALLLPSIFHAINIGHVFMPMYIPLITLAFLVRPSASTSTAFIVPLASGLATGMPPINPPIALTMAVEIGLMAALIGMGNQLFHRINVHLLLATVLIIGRVMYSTLYFLLANAIGLPAQFFTWISLISALPGIILIMLIVPPMVQRFRKLSLQPHC